MSLAWLLAVLYLLATTVVFSVQKKSFNNESSIPFGFILLFFLLLRLIAASLTDGYASDMACWAAWGNRMEQLGASNFYLPDYFCDYPPGYLYILGILSHFASFFHLPETGYYFLLKLPPILADLGIGILVFQYAKKNFNPSFACLVAGFFLLSPVFFYDSSVWGQVDSVLLLFLLLATLRLMEKHYSSGILFYVIAVLIKPQGLLLAPIVLFSLLDSRNIKKILLSLLAGFVLFLIAIIPFSPAWQDKTGLGLFLNLLNPWWMIETYFKTMASYPYFTVNAFNFYALLGLNWVPLTQTYSILLSAIHSLILAIGVVGAGYFYAKTDRAMRFWLSGYFLFGFLFTFAFKMHERYLLLPLLFLFFGYLASGNKKLLFLFSGFSGVGFCNLFYILRLSETTQSLPDYRIIFPLALAEVILFLISIVVIAKDFLGFNIPLPKINIPLFFRSQRQRRMSRLDTLLLSGIMLLYTLVAYFNLGDTSAPQTYYQPTQKGETITLTFEKPEPIAEIDYYCGIGKVSQQPGLLLSYSVDGETWKSLETPVCQLKTVFYWEVQPLEESIVAKHIRLTAESNEYMLFEVGFRTTEGTLATITSSHPIVDEQSLVTNMPSYENGTYFDEIYHPRTAFEHLHFLPYYETTHPPLGKLIMAIGIALFGMTPFGWRFMGVLTGILMLPLFYLLLKKLFSRTRYAVIGTLLFAFDFMHFSLTRLATIDSYPVLFIIGMYYFMYQFACQMRSPSIPWKSVLYSLALSGLFMGLGCASKWTAVYAAAGLGIEFFVILILRYREYKQDFRQIIFNLCPWCVLFFIVVPAIIYILSYLPIAMVEGYGNVFEVMLENQTYMFEYHSMLNDTHPYSSPWYSWPFVYKPMWAYQAPETSIPAGTIGCISIFQNPLLSWAGICAFAYSLVVGFKKKDVRVLFLTIGLLAQYLPWALVSRYAMQYHFFASMVFLVLFVAYAMQDLESRFPKFKHLSASFTALCLIMFIIFYPVLSGVPVSRFWAESVLTWFDSWVFFI